MKPSHLSERGLTLIEVTVVAVLATLVMLGIVGFYISSQGTWMDASAQAITQREATTVVESIASKVHAAHHAEIAQNGTQLELYTRDGTLLHVFWWNAAPGNDSLLHEGNSLLVDGGPMSTSKCDRFQVARDGQLVYMDLILRSTQGDRFTLSTRVALMNRDPS